MQNGITKFFLLLLVITSSLWAQERVSSFYFSLVGMNMDYREYDMSGDILDSESSSYSDMIGYDLGYKYYLLFEGDDYSVIDVNVLYNSGSSRYVGAYLSGGGYGSVVSNTSNDIVDFALSYERYKTVDAATFLYGMGVGYKSWLRRLSSSQEELYYWFYLKAILGVKYNISKVTYVELKGYYNYALNPALDTNFGVNFDLGKTDIAGGQISLGYDYSKNVELFTSYVYEKQQIAASEIKWVGTSAYYEPDSTAQNQYIKFGISLNY